VSDSYQPFESERKLCRETLELLYRFNHPVHILTKSTLVERDIDVLQKINQQKKAVVSFSFSSVDDTIGKQLEPGVPSPSKRLETLKKFKAAGINCGMYLMPVIPHITDTYEMLEQTVSKARDTGVDFIVFGGMSLKPGRQKDYFITFLKKQYPQLFANYEKIYGNNDPWGWPDQRYSQMIDKRFNDIATKYKMPKRMPSCLFDRVVSRNELVLLILEQLDYLVKQKGMDSPYGYAAYSLSLLKRPVDQMSAEELRSIKGIGSFTAKLIREICETGRCEYYEKML
jgi:DNA repair photolyase